MVDDANLERARTTSRRTAERAARQRLFNIYDLPIDRDARVEDTALADALQIIGRHEGIDFKIPARSGPSDSPIGLVDILDASGVRARRVRFKAEGNWWRGDSNAMLAFRAEDGQPVALLPGMFGRYREIDPVSKRSVRVTAERAGALAESLDVLSAIAVGDVKPADLLGIALHGSAADLARLVIAGLPGGLIKLLPALALGFVANHVVAGGSAGALYAVAVAVAGFGLLGALLHLLTKHGDDAARGALGIAGRSCLLGPPHAPSAKHPAPPSSRRSGHVGNDIPESSRWLAGSRRRQPAVDHFSASGFGVIFIYDATLGVVTLVFSLASLLITVVLGLRQISPYGRMISAARRVAGRLFQIVERHRQAACGKRGRVGLRHLGTGLSRAETRGDRTGRARGTFAGIRRRAPLSCRRGAAFRGGSGGETETSRSAIFSSFTRLHRFPVRHRPARRVLRHHCRHAAGVRSDAPAARRSS